MSLHASSVLNQGSRISRGFLLLAMLGTTHAQIEPFEKCRATFQGIINGSLVVGPWSNYTIWDSGLLYTGTFHSLDPSYPRDRIITPTIIGKSAT